MDSPSFRLDGKTVAVIGAGSGIGEAIALGCASGGAYVCCLDLSPKDADRVCAEIVNSGGEAQSKTVDVSNRNQVDRALVGLAQRRGRLDGVVCTPGVNVRKPLLEYTEAEFDRVVDTNLKGSFQVLQSAGRIMREQGGGSILLLSSIRAATVEPGQSVYAATKSGIVQLVKAAAAELGAKNVRVNALAPGVVDTPLTAPIKAHPDWYQAYADKNALNRWADADELAGPAVFLLSDAASYVTGSVLFVDGGWTAIDGRFSPPGM